MPARRIGLATALCSRASTAPCASRPATANSAPTRTSTASRRQPPAGPDSASLAAARAAEANSLTRIANAIDADEWRTLAAPLVEPVLHRATEDPDALLADLATACPDLATDDLTDRPARILFVADLWGRTSESPG